MTMPRSPETEVMSDPAGVDAYSSADFSEVNQAFAEAFLLSFPPNGPRSILDLGCGPADIPIRLAALEHSAQITAVDASLEMLAKARQAVSVRGLTASIALHHGRIPGIPLQPSSFEAIISNSILHHIPDPADFWAEIRRLGKPHAAVWVMDLARPESTAAARAIVEQAAADEHPLLKEDFYNSLLAAYTPEEIEAQLDEAGLRSLRIARNSDRHWTVSGRLP